MKSTRKPRVVVTVPSIAASVLGAVLPGSLFITSAATFRLLGIAVDKILRRDSGPSRAIVVTQLADLPFKGGGAGKGPAAAA